MRFYLANSLGRWLVRPNSTSLYQFNQNENFWQFAREKCLAQGGDLVSFNDRAELVHHAVA